MKKIVKIRVISMYESCERWSFYVELTTDEGFTITPCCHQTGSTYNNHEGLRIEEARDRALSDATYWGDLLQIEPEPYIVNDQVIETTWKRDSYTIQRELAKRKLTKT